MTDEPGKVISISGVGKDMREILFSIPQFVLLRTIASMLLAIKCNKYARGVHEILFVLKLRNLDEKWMNAQEQVLSVTYSELIR